MKTFTSVAQMKLAFLTAGQQVETSGYYTPGDGGQAKYLIKASEAVDGFGDHTLAGTTVAILQVGMFVGVLQYGAKADSALGAPGTDNTANFQAAVDSPHPVHPEAGYFAIDGTVFIISGGSTQGGKTFIMTSNTRLERFGASLKPILHVVGEQNYVDGSNGILAVRVAGIFSDGLLLWGTDPLETDETSLTSRVSQKSVIKNFKIIGKTSNTGWNGSVGMRVESSGRFRGDFQSPTHFQGYYSSIENIFSTQWDFPFHFSTDSNALSVIGCTSDSFGHAAYSINGYANLFLGCKAEIATAQDATERFVWYWGKKDDPFGPETGCDKDAPSVVITGITNANPAVVTAVGHGEITAAKIKIEGVVDAGAGTLEAAVNGGHFQIIRLTDDTFSIPIDTSADAAYSSAGIVRTDFYPILGARGNKIICMTEVAFDLTTKKLRLHGYGIPLVSYDVADSRGNWARNKLDISGYSTVGGIGKDGFSNDVSVGRNDIETSDLDIYRSGKKDIHGTIFSRLDDDSGPSVGTDEYKTFSGRMANLADSDDLTVITISGVGPTSASVIIKLDFIYKEGVNQDHEGGELSWLCPVAASTAQTPIKIKDFQANYNAAAQPYTTWTVAPSTVDSKGVFELKVNTGNPAGVGDAFITWWVTIISSQLEGNGIDWDADVTIQNGGQ